MTPRPQLPATSAEPCPGGADAGFRPTLVECPECWEEVRLGGVGRGYAEAGRELAPQDLRDRIRGEVALVSARPRLHLRIGMGILALALGAAGGAFLAATSDQPPAIEALVADFRGDRQLHGAAPAALPERLGDLTLVGVAAGQVDGLSVVGHRYRDAAGHGVTVYRADRPFPALVVGDDAREVVLAARVLGMT